MTHNPIRVLVTAVCVAIGSLCLILVPPSLWTHYVLLDTDRYVKTLHPLAKDANVQQLVISHVEDEITQHISLPSALLQQAAFATVHEVTSAVVHSKAFPALWDIVVRDTHPQVEYALTGRIRGDAQYVSRTGVVTLHLGPLTAQVRKDLLAAGLEAAAGLPDMDATVDIAGMRGFKNAQPVIRGLDSGATWFPIAGLGALVLALLIAPNWRVVTAAAGGLLAVGMLVEFMALFVAGQSFDKSVPRTEVPARTADYTFSTVTYSLRIGILVMLAGAVAALVVSWLKSDTRRQGPQPVRRPRPR